MVMVMVMVIVMVTVMKKQRRDERCGLRKRQAMPPHSI
jgi:hypothetical protein